MVEESLRYAFLTTGEETVFLMMDYEDRGKLLRDNRDVNYDTTGFVKPRLSITYPLRHTNKMGQPNGQPNGNIGVRMAYLYMFHHIMAHWALPVLLKDTTKFIGVRKWGDDYALPRLGTGL